MTIQFATEKAGIVIGLDVGKSSRWACVVTRDGEVCRAARCQHAPRAAPQRVAQPKPKTRPFPNLKRGVPADTPLSSAQQLRRQTETPFSPSPS